MSMNQVECGSELIFITICQYIPNIVGVTCSYLTYLKLPLVATVIHPKVLNTECTYVSSDRVQDS